MFTKQTIFGVMTIVSIFCGISSYPTIQTDLNNLQSIDDLSDKKRPLPDVAATVEQVRKMLQDDPTLPRLTKGEIEDLFEQVAKEEYEKSLQMGDLQRATNMRALMLVLPYNSENTTDEALQELYTRPPITKVIDSYSVPKPQKFQTAAPTQEKPEVIEVGNLPPTTYKPFFRMKDKSYAKPTTYHPMKPLPKLPKEPSTSQVPFEVPVTSLPLLPDIEEVENKPTRYSSSYSAKDPDWSLLEGEFNNGIQFSKKFTPMPDLSSIFKSMGMAEEPKQYKVEAYRPSISSSIRQPGLGTVDIADFTRTLPPRPQIEAYSEFKPLNIGEEIRIKPDIEDYLSRFGIVNRKRKQIKPEDSGEVSLPVAPTVQPAKVEPIRRIDTNIDATSLNNLKEEEEIAQLNKLLNNLQELERLNVSLTANMIKNANTSNLNLANGPDPLGSDTDLRKNDSKRQSENESTTTESSKVDSDSDDSDTDTETTKSKTEDEPSTTEKESSNGSLSDLEDSFGGPDPITEDPSPPPKKNGFYFLADWNSFLEVGEAGVDQVVVRYDKKIGDPRRFLKVTVP